MPKPSLAAPFDKLPSTMKYAQQLADDTGRPQVVIRTRAGSAADQAGMLFGVLAADAVHEGDRIVETVNPHVRGLSVARRSRRPGSPRVAVGDVVSLGSATPRRPRSHFVLKS